MDAYTEIKPITRAQRLRSQFTSLQAREVLADDLTRRIGLAKQRFGVTDFFALPQDIISEFEETSLDLGLSAEAIAEDWARLETELAADEIGELRLLLCGLDMRD